MDKKNNKPQIRFIGFTDPWEQRKLKDEVEIIMGQSPAGNTYSDIPNGHILVQGNADLKNGWVSPRIWTTQITKKADKGDLIMSVRAPAGEIGKTAFNVVLGRGVAAIKGNEFIFQTLSKMNKDSYWKKLSCGSTFESINSDNIKSAKIKISSPIEQNKIGSLFLQIDNLITLHQRKLYKLKIIKKSLLEKMFPKTGKTIPEIRFKNFTEPWEQRKFGDLAEYKKGPFGSALKKDFFVPKNTTTVKVYEQQNAIKKNWKLERYYITKDLATKLKSFKLSSGDIIVSCAGTIGEVYELPPEAEYGIINQALMRVRVNQSIINKNLFIIVFSNMIDRFSHQNSNGSAIKNIPPFSDLKQAETFLPTSTEQEKVVKIVRNIDNLITLHQRQLEKLKNLKKSLLDKMFV
ncbi:MAG: restriction endonuclease subunit S [Sphaerochaetaceae bacterium]|nr:restriction endonuclease subunit S [Sphaerochaetaceae bacterium]